MSAAAAEVEAVQPAVVADATPAEATTQEPTIKQEERPDKPEEQIKQEESATDPEAPVKQEGVVKTEETAVAEKMEGVEKGTGEGDGQANSEETNSKIAPMLKTRAELHKDKSNKKYNPSVLAITNDPKTIRDQIEFYFGDSNLPTDKHMWNITGGTENKPVKVKHICSFGRCKRFQPYSAVVAALRDSNMLEVSGPEGDEEIKRKKPYVAASDSYQARLAASVYVKGFGDETPTTQFDIEAFFARYGPVNVIRLRRTEEEYFKGSVFVEFPSEEAAKAFVALDPAPTYQGHELKIMSKRAYIEEKNELIKEGKLVPRDGSKHKKFWQGKDLGDKGRGGKFRKDGGSDDWKKRRENDQKNGFRDGQRGGRGRGRGGRGRGGRDDRNGRGGRGGRGGRDQRRNEDAPVSTNNVQKPRIQSSEVKQEVKQEDLKKETSPSNGKRARNDDGASERPAKKVDTKVEATTAERND